MPGVRGVLFIFRKKTRLLSLRREETRLRKCKIHCYGKGYKERAKEIMAFSGPKLLLKHPILSMRHIMALFREPPEKPTAAKPRPLAKENN